MHVKGRPEKFPEGHPGMRVEVVGSLYHGAKGVIRHVGAGPSGPAYEVALTIPNEVLQNFTGAELEEDLTPRSMTFVKLRPEFEQKISEARARSIRTPEYAELLPPVVVDRQYLLFIGEIKNAPGACIIQNLTFNWTRLYRTELFMELPLTEVFA